LMKIAKYPPKCVAQAFRFPITSARRSWLTPTNCYLETCGVIRSLGQSSVGVAQALRFRNTAVVTSAMRGWLNRFSSGDMGALSTVSRSPKRSALAAAICFSSYSKRRLDRSSGNARALSLLDNLQISNARLEIIYRNRQGYSKVGEDLSSRGKIGSRLRRWYMENRTRAGMISG
jgi:hypothetical protein